MWLSADPGDARNRELVETVARNLGEQLTGGEKFDSPGAWVLFASMVLPVIELADVASEGGEILVVVRLQDLSFLVPPVLFQHRHLVSWEAFVHEFGDEPAIVRILPFTVSRPIHVIALEYLAEQRVSALLGSAGLLEPQAAKYGKLFVLNNSNLQAMTPAVRQQADGLSNAETRRLDESQV
jgi:hypothetical protein